MHVTPEVVAIVGGFVSVVVAIVGASWRASRRAARFELLLTGWIRDVDERLGALEDAYGMKQRPRARSEPPGGV